MEYHQIEPVYDKDSKILILGSFPSVRSRKAGFFYGHPQNRFWKTVAAVFEEDVPATIEEKKKMLLRNGIALWDVVASCEIEGSSDSSIRNVKPNDIKKLIGKTSISRIYVNGRTALKLYRKYLEEQLDMEAAVLPSTSPANAVYSLDRLVEEWRIIKES
ncbi:MAG: DNA-deoxyinosine glycosylase [Erysipelotrichaceae bacterium]|nr:DNA-deoxyinosine glycosylase [Erysipelotrichaceae bacterium]MBR2533178.1 DNA-deoxyinosine glycosylase [Erysipelotrichaceae bacterium]